MITLKRRTTLLALIMWLFARIFLLTLLPVWSRASSPLDSKAKVVALVFLSSECPISNRMAPEIERISRQFSSNDLFLCIVYPNHSDSEKVIAEHRASYRLQCPFVRDLTHDLVKKSLVVVTPEAAVFDEKRALVYHGRITDQFLALGRSRPEATSHDLEDAIAAAVGGRVPKESSTKAVGCFIEEK